MTTDAAPASPPSAASPPASAAAEGSPFGPFRHKAFTVLWLATVASNIGTWVQNAAAGWLMTGLDPDPFIVALVQVATTLPMFLFGLPAGALADIVDRRRLLLVVQIVATALIAVLGALVWLDRVTPVILLAFTFLAGVTAAMIAPAWQAIVPQLVPRPELQPAVALNSVGVNISRAVGPALAGLLIGALGLAAPFWVNALSNLGVIAALLWWRPAAASLGGLPRERLRPAMHLGLRHARHNPHLRATLIRAAGFFTFASAYWALLPLVARQQIAGTPQLYGLLLGTIGAGAVGGAFLLPVLKKALGPDRLVMAGTAGTALALVLFALARHPAVAFIASAFAGASWIAVLAPINVSAQIGLPDWVKGRGLALFATVQFGAMTLGSLVWGQAAKLAGLPLAHLVAAAGAVGAIPLLRRWRIQSGAGLDFTPSLHWPAPILAGALDDARGPVLVTVDYRIRADDREAFLAALARLGEARRRDGAYEWGAYEDAAMPGRIVETFLLASWADHRRQHGRTTRADAEIQAAANAFHTGPEPPAVTHLIAAETAGPGATGSLRTAPG